MFLWIYTAPSDCAADYFIFFFFCDMVILYLLSWNATAMAIEKNTQLETIFFICYYFFCFFSSTDTFLCMNLLVIAVCQMLDNLLFTIFKNKDAN